MKLNLVPVYLKDVTFKMEKVKDRDVRVVVLSLFIQPLTYAIANAMAIAGELFNSPNTPNDILRKGELALGQGKKTHLVQLHATVDASDDPMFSTTDAFLGPALKVKRDKEGPVFAGSIEVNFEYPEPKQLLSLANGINQQYWVNIEPTNPGLFEEADREAARDEKKRKRQAGEQQNLPANGTGTEGNTTPATP